MDIRNWPMDRIMQLPDCCFGRRWPVVASNFTTHIGENYAISKAGFPESFVIWEIVCRCVGVPVLGAGVFLAMGDNLPLTGVEFLAMQPLISGFGRPIVQTHEVQIAQGERCKLRRVKIPIKATGRRLVIRYDVVAADPIAVEAHVVVSAIPMEVPDCLLSV